MTGNSVLTILSNLVIGGLCAYCLWGVDRKDAKDCCADSTLIFNPTNTKNMVKSDTCKGVGVTNVTEEWN